MSNTILQVIKIDENLIDEIKPSFNRLPETDHADGKYRLRKYAQVEVFKDNNEWHGKLLSVSEFTQSSKYNKHQGDRKRVFETIEEEVVSSKALREMFTAFCEACSLPEGHQFDIHQMRVKCRGGATQLSPEGWHQDGYDCVAIIGVDRNNIIGGDVLLSTNKTDPPFLQGVMDSGTMVMVDDSFLWHNGKSIQPIKDDEPAWMDILVFTSRKAS